MFSANLILLMQKCLLGTVAAKVKLLPQFKNCNRVTTSDKCRRVPKGADFYFILFFYHSTGSLECRNASWMCRSFRRAALTNWSFSLSNWPLSLA